LSPKKQKEIKEKQRKNAFLQLLRIYLDMIKLKTLVIKTAYIHRIASDTQSMNPE
jgi:hypothetical protein